MKKMTSKIQFLSDLASSLASLRNLKANLEKCNGDYLSLERELQLLNLASNSLDQKGTEFVETCLLRFQNYCETLQFVSFQFFSFDLQIG
jgi:hypothetical protein